MHVVQSVHFIVLPFRALFKKSLLGVWTGLYVFWGPPVESFQYFWVSMTWFPEFWLFHVNTITSFYYGRSKVNRVWKLSFRNVQILSLMCNTSSQSSIIAGQPRVIYALNFFSTCWKHPMVLNVEVSWRSVIFFEEGLKFAILHIGSAHNNGQVTQFKIVQISLFLIFLNINSNSYSFITIASQNRVKYFECSWYFEKYSDSRCSHHGDSSFNVD